MQEGRGADAALVAIVDHPILGHSNVRKNNGKEREKFTIRKEKNALARRLRS